MYAKFYAALVAGIAAAVSVTADNEFSLNDAFVCGSALIGALAVYFIPNKES